VVKETFREEHLKPANISPPFWLVEGLSLFETGKEEWQKDRLSNITHFRSTLSICPCLWHF
jgi:hypothetical protein